MKTFPTFRTRGFTLVEMAVVMVIMGLIIGGLLMPISMQAELRSRQETRKTMDTIKEALIGYALTNGHLPCPDLNGDGVEDRVTGGPWDSAPNTLPNPDEITRTTERCQDAANNNLYQGRLPFVTIGVGRSDDWGSLFTYRVSPEFSDRYNVWPDSDGSGTLNGAAGTEETGAALRTDTSLLSQGNIEIGEHGDDLATVAVETKAFIPLIGGTAANGTAPSTSNAAAVIISHGKNRFNSVDAITGIAYSLLAPDGVSDEDMNADNGVQKIARTPTSTIAPCDDFTEGSDFCEYDDMVDWISPSVLLSRMVSAGILP